MRKSNFIIAFLMGLCIMFVLGFSLDSQTALRNTYAANLENCINESVEYNGTISSTDKFYANHYAYLSEEFKYIVEPINGQVVAIERIDNQNTAQMQSASIASEASLQEYAEEIYLQFMTEDTEAYLDIGSTNTGWSFDFEICEKKDGRETGNRAIIFYDAYGNMTNACFFRKTESDISKDAVELTKDQAEAIAYEYITDCTLSGEITGSENVVSMNIKSNNAEIRVWKGTSFWEFVIEADVLFGDRGTVDKTYTVDVDLYSGEILECVWTLN